MICSGNKGGGGLLEALGNVTGTIKEKLSMTVSGSGHEQHGGGEGKIVVGVEEVSPAGKVTYEGVAVLERKEGQGKM